MLLFAILTACSRSQTSKQDQLSTQVAALSTQVAAQSTQNAQQDEIISYLATQQMAPFAPTRSVVPTPYYPVTGSVLIEDGICCVGGIAGSTIEVSVTFTASSPLADVVDMRVRFGGIPFNEAEMEEAAWEPFVPEKTFQITFIINWVGHWVSVQYRDALGNLSPVYTDDVSAEGMPAPTP